MFNSISIAALFAGLAAARTTYTTQGGNPITKPLNEIVPACAPFSINWTPTNKVNTVSLILLKGPSTNVVPLYPIVEGIAPSGSFSWTPKSDLEATTTPTGYGIMIIDDVTGEFQYSTQFGISKAGCVASASSSAPSTASSSAAVKTTSSAAGYGAISAPVSSPIVQTKTPVSVPSTLVTSAPVAPSGTGVPANGSIIYPTKSMTVPASLRPTPTGNSTLPPQFTGAASPLQAGMGVAGFVAAVIAML